MLPIIETTLGSLKETIEQNGLCGDSIAAVGGSIIVGTADGLAVVVGAVAAGVAGVSCDTVALAVLAVAAIATCDGDPGDIAGCSDGGVARRID